MNVDYDYSKTVKDNYGDPTTVEADKGNLVVEVITDTGSDRVEMVFSPAAARKLARHLRKAADVAEGKDSEPETYVDIDGDYWYPAADGNYWCGLPGQPVGSWSLAEIKERFGAVKLA